MNNKEVQEKFEQLASAIDWIKTKLVDLQEEKGLAPVKTPYEVEVPEDIGDYYYADEIGELYIVRDIISSQAYKEVYQRGIPFKTEEEVEQYDKERILLFKLHKWAEEHNGGWTPDWKDFREPKYTIAYEYRQFVVSPAYTYQQFLKVPYFKTKELAEQFIDEFGEEIKEVFC